ncbi:MAG TPA: prepilin-type N-terminal cleavage/methylation domain-containing protein [Phycisphaerae bacterium]|nr:prepilin-type N-terminal cleavage/methylation domain-containing protein [Phycisphaerae bacterium]
MEGSLIHKWRSRSAFTLIELLVVVSIIALLIAILLPAIGKAKIKAGTVVCATRLHGLGNAMATYLAEYDNRFPINGLLMPKPKVPARYLLPGADPRFQNAEETNVQKWRLEYGALWPNMGGISVAGIPVGSLPIPPAGVAKAYLCPNDTLNRTYAANSTTVPLTMQPVAGGTSQVKQGAGQPGYWSYSINAVVNSLGRLRDNASFGPVLPWQDPMTFSQIRNPSNFIYFIEEDEASLFNDEVFDAPAFGGGDSITNRHNAGGNLGFADNHVEWVSQVAFDAGNGNPPGTAVNIVMQSPWTRPFFPDGGEFAGP